MDEVGSKASNPVFANAARLRVLNKYLDPVAAKTGRGVFKDPAATMKKNEPEVLERDLGADFFG